MIDLAPILARVDAVLEACRLGPTGQYRRWASTRAAPDDAAPNPYACADAANLLHSLGRLPDDAGDRRAFVRALHAFQDPETGFFREATHHEIHVTAHCVAALELFDARPAHPLSGLSDLAAPGALETFLDDLDWRDDPWLASHRGAGVYAARLLAGESTVDWESRYFDWLDAECDPRSGLWRNRCLERPYRWGSSRFPHLAGSFHYLFNYEHAKRPHPHPAALVDTCLSIHAAGDEWPLGRTVSFAEIDWVYCLSRAARQSGHRTDEADDTLRRFARAYVEFLLDLDWASDDGACDLHRVFGMTCALAELTSALPGEIRAPVRLRLVLDRRPFI